MSNLLYILNGMYRFTLSADAFVCEILIDYKMLLISLVVGAILYYKCGDNL